MVTFRGGHTTRLAAGIDVSAWAVALPECDVRSLSGWFIADNDAVNFVRWFFSPRSRDDWRSWNALFIAAPFAFGLVFILTTSTRDHAIAARQGSTVGVVTAYEPSNHNQCSYTFQLQGKQYQGKGSSPTTTATVGQQVRVYFDRDDPATSSLEDFEAESRRERRILPFLTVGIAAVIGFILYSKVRRT